LLIDRSEAGELSAHARCPDPIWIATIASTIARIPIPARQNQYENDVIGHGSLGNVDVK
jgi:hypothetical protein